MVKQNVVYSPDGMLFIRKKELSAYQYTHKVDSLNCILLKERGKLKGYILYDPIYMIVWI